MSDQAATNNDGSEKKGLLSPERRRPLLIGLVVAVLVIAGLVWAYEALIASRTVSTDNAYVGADNAQVTPLTSGQVVKLNVVNTQHVKAGEVLMKLDDSDQQIAYAQAQADLAAVKRQYQQTVAQGAALGATADAQSAAISQARENLRSAQADLAKAQSDYERRAAIAKTGAVSADELVQAETALKNAQAAVRQRQAAVQSAVASQRSATRNAQATLALVKGTDINSAPAVLQAEAKLRQAKLNLDRTVIRAPMTGVIAKQTVQVGQRVNNGQVTMVIVPVNQLYVDANFKENQLGKVRVGQPVTLTSDYYGGDVKYHGRVMGFAGGTGAAFALIPAQNATGNWIKVVQRLPVRIALEPKELQSHPLRVGLSMNATIDVTGQH